MSLAVMAAADEGRVYGDGDCRRDRRRWYCGSVAELLAGLKRVTTQCLRTSAGLNRQKVPEKIGGAAIRYQCGNMCSQVVELRRRPAVGQSADTAFAVTSPGAAKTWQPNSVATR